MSEPAGVDAPRGLKVAPDFRVVVLASGFGSNLQALIDATSRAAGAGAAGDGLGLVEGPTVVAVFSDKPGAFALERARNAGIPAFAMPPPGKAAGSAARRAYDASLADAVSSQRPDLVFLLGWMRVLSSAFISRFPGRLVNLHPALPGTFPGTHAIEKALEAFRAGTIRATGAMVHFVPDEGVDTGPVIAAERVDIRADDDLAALEARVHEAERRLVVGTLGTLYIRGVGGTGQRPDSGSPV